jgi:hypothetical protein
MSDQSKRFSDMEPRGGRPLDDNEFYVMFSAKIDGQEFFFDTVGDYGGDDYRLTISLIGKRGRRDPSRFRFTAEQLKLIKEGISEYFREHGQLRPDSKPPRTIIFKDY